MCVRRGATEIPPPVSLSRPLLQRGDRSAERGAPLPGWALLPGLPPSAPYRLLACKAAVVGGSAPPPPPYASPIDPPSTLQPEQGVVGCREAVREGRGGRGAFTHSARLTGGRGPRPEEEEGGGAVEFWQNAAECTTCRYCIELQRDKRGRWRGCLRAGEARSCALPLLHGAAIC